MNTETRDNAHRHYATWTGPELELLSRADLTVRQLSVMLGRSYTAITRMRYRLEREPKLDWLAGRAAR